jgi:hypothetical protein
MGLVSETLQTTLNVPVPADLTEDRLERQFNNWVAAGEGRSFKEVAEAVGLPMRDVLQHVRKFQWRQRLGDIQSRASDKTRDMLAESVADLNFSHVAELRALRSAALEALRRMPLTKHSDATKLYFECLKMEREVTGLKQSSQQRELADVLSEKLKEVRAEPETKQDGYEFQLEAPRDDGEVPGE